VLAFQPFKPSALRAVQSSKFQVQGVLQIVPAVQPLRSVQTVQTVQRLAAVQKFNAKTFGVYRIQHLTASISRRSTRYASLFNG